MKEVWIIGYYEDIVKVFSCVEKAYDFYREEREKEPWGLWIERWEVE
jgi:hypothetical protein